MVPGLDERRGGRGLLLTSAIPHSSAAMASSAWPWFGEAGTLDWHETYALHDAAERGDVSAITQLLDSGQHDIEEVEPQRRWRPLLYAVANGHAAAATVLLAHGAQIASGGDGSQLLLHSLNSGSFPVARLVMQALRRSGGLPSAARCIFERASAPDDEQPPPRKGAPQLARVHSIGSSADAGGCSALAASLPAPPLPPLPPRSVTAPAEIYPSGPPLPTSLPDREPRAAAAAATATASASSLASALASTTATVASAAATAAATAPAASPAGAARARASSRALIVGPGYALSGGLAHATALAWAGEAQQRGLLVTHSLRARVAPSRLVERLQCGTRRLLEADSIVCLCLCLCFSRRLLEADNLGGESELSEALSYELLSAVFGAPNAALCKTEREIAYRNLHGARTDYLASFHQRRCGVSVTRAYERKGAGDSAPRTELADAERLLRKKLNGIIET